MNKKDLMSLSESYQKIFENTISDMVGAESEFDDVPNDFEKEEVVHDPKQHVDDFINDEDVRNMFISNVSSIRSYSHKILKHLETSQKVDAWMADKIAVISSDIKDVCDAMEFGQE